MDGNGRWAVQRGKSRSFGHQEGLKITRQMLDSCIKRNIPYLSLYIFSTENWKRTEAEVGFLMDLIVKNIRKEYDLYREKGIRLLHSGHLESLPLKVQQEINSAISDTADFKNLTLNLVINYGGRDEIWRAAQAYARAIDLSGPHATIETFSNYLDNPEIPDVDFLIRTGGEKRLSNFLLWKTAYAELFFSDLLWPDWSDSAFEEALEDYRKRNRRFGGTS